jgi:hypothetical protein
MQIHRTGIAVDDEHNTSESKEVVSNLATCNNNGEYIQNVLTSFGLHNNGHDLVHQTTGSS